MPFFRRLMPLVVLLVASRAARSQVDFSTSTKTVAPASTANLADPMSFTIVVTNSGNVAASNAVLGDVFAPCIDTTLFDPVANPTQVLVNGSPAAGASYVAATRTLSVPLGGVGPVTSLTVVVSGLRAGAVLGSCCNAATITCNEIGPTSTNNDCTTIVSATTSGTKYVSTIGDDANDCLAPGRECYTIQAAIDKSNPGDTLLVAPGTFTENVVVDRSLSIRGSRAAATLVSGNSLGSVMVIQPGTVVRLVNLTLDFGKAAFGGGINDLGADVTVEDSTIHGNTGDTHGGGIYSVGTVRLVNTTVSQNTTPGFGGGIHSTGTFTATHATISDNTAGDAGGLYVIGTATLRSTLLGGNTDSGSPECGGSFTSLGYNQVVPTASCTWTPTTGDIVAALAGVLPIADNGGPTWTHGLTVGSTATDSGEPPPCDLPVDQRGVARPQFERCDIGAFEFKGADRYAANYGSDLDDCLTPATPCRTIQAAVNKAPDGSRTTVHVAAGDYVENVTIPTAKQWIVVEGDRNWPTVVDGNNAGPVFTTASNAWADFVNLTITHGHAANGGGILSDGTTTVRNCLITTNDADNNGAGVYAQAASARLINSTVCCNHAVGDGGGVAASISGTVTLDGVTVKENTSDGGAGGVGVGGLTTLHDSVLAYNWGPVATECAGSVASQGHNLVLDPTGCSFAPATGDLLGVDPVMVPLADNGGPTWTVALDSTSPAIDAGDPTSCDLRVDQRGWNRPVGLVCDIGAYEFSPDLYVDPAGDDSNACTDPGNPCKTIQAAVDRATAGVTIHLGAGTYVEDVSVATSLRIRGFGPDAASLTSAGAGVLLAATPGSAVQGTGTGPVFDVAPGIEVHFTLMTISNGSFTNGGGIHNAGTLIVDTCTVTANNASQSGGGIQNSGSLTVTRTTLSGNTSGGSGGGIANVGTLVVEASTLSGNQAQGSGGGVVTSGPATVTNSTLSGNTANGPGGGIASQALASLALRNSTVTLNTGSAAGGLWSADGAVVSLDHSILAGNIGAARDCAGPGQSLGHSLIQAPALCGIETTASDLLSQDPLLGPLQDNGGPTWTHAPTAGSPVIDAGDPVRCGAGYDQRGVARPQGLSCELGAVESCVSDPLPPEQGDVLRAVKSATGVLLSFPGAPATRWRLYRDSDKAAIGATPRSPVLVAPAYYDDGVVADGVPRHYVVRGLSGCSHTPGP